MAITDAVRKGLETATGSGLAIRGALNVPVTTDASGNVVEVVSSTLAGNRYITGVEDTQATMGHMTWAPNTGVRSVWFRITGGSAGDVVAVVFDAAPVGDTTDDAQAWAWLQPATASESADVEYFELTQGPGSGGPDDWCGPFEFTAELRRADFLARTALAVHNIEAEVR